MKSLVDSPFHNTFTFLYVTSSKEEPTYVVTYVGRLFTLS